MGGLTEKRLSDWQVTHRARYSPTRTNGATTVLREMVEAAVKDNMLSKAVATAALPGLRYVKVKYDYKRLLQGQFMEALAGLELAVRA